MKMKETEPKLPKRRDVLKLAALGGGLAGVAAVVGGAPAAAAAAVEPATPSAAGYRESAQVKKYYELARF